MPKNKWLKMANKKYEGNKPQKYNGKKCQK